MGNVVSPMQNHQPVTANASRLNSLRSRFHQAQASMKGRRNGCPEMTLEEDLHSFQDNMPLEKKMKFMFGFRVNTKVSSYDKTEVENEWAVDELEKLVAFQRSRVLMNKSVKQH